MHTRKALDDFIQLNAKEGKHFKMQNVKHFDEFNITSNKIFVQELDNGVLRVQLPKDGAFKNASARNKALAYNPDGSEVKGAKNLLPDNWTFSSTANATDNISQILLIY